ncbi:hypothetical protein [Cellvibrio japonicus]|uniref:Uncharacterized protein n=1 Tax=Cellvibrio japonicus (strain Ueda107) TaxID=498211 RepID=B3PLC5_CELJU|nr:hypothetical protein [Cellvibrio japonicus]ACE85480.1 hypothetical protein CJA_0949 [Cellvibrio japonicus Ueda107]QEI11579.1 hypothetical protein FY117_04620 [Cellvibrio japonicus]QEI15153.1 hypothetical protein FY116_04620 [Cellvibrio japonicus]QEI18733.1 hypothetical protein FY115_04620 [Cellvibrio japonicus]
MPIEIKNASSSPNKTVAFDFSDKVLAYVVGITYWKFSFGSDDHHVKTLLLSLETNQPNSTQVTATITARLDDDTGHGINNGDSLINVSCIAVVTAADSNITLANANGISSGSSSTEISLPSNTLSIGAAFLSGWSLSQSADHHVKTFQTTAGFKQSGNLGQITSQAQMIDSSGNFANGAINGGLVAASTAERGILSKALVNQQTGSSQDVNFNVNLKDASVMLQSLTATFGSKDHHIKSIGGGCSGWKVNGQKVTLNNAQAFITDDSGNSQSNSDSSVSLVVFAIPA